MKTITNPIFNNSNRDEALAFDLIKIENYLPALEEAVHLGRDEINKIKKHKADPNFENSILGLELSGLEIDRVVSVFSNLESVIGDET